MPLGFGSKVVDDRTEIIFRRLLLFYNLRMDIPTQIQIAHGEYNLRVHLLHKCMSLNLQNQHLR